MGAFYFFRLMFRTPCSKVFRGALTTRPYRPGVSIASRSYAAASEQFAANPCYEADTSVIKGDFDFWAYREQQTNQRQQDFEKERKDLVSKYSPMGGDDLSFNKNLEIALQTPTFRETVSKMSADLDSFSSGHFQALAEREALRGEPMNVRTVHLMMLAQDISTNEQDYTILFRSYWKNGTAAHLVALLKEMNMFGLNPTQSMIDIAAKACKAAKDTQGEKAVKAITTNHTRSNNVALKAKLELDAKELIRKTDLTREILETEAPPGNFFFSMFDTHKKLR